MGFPLAPVVAKIFTGGHEQLNSKRNVIFFILKGTFWWHFLYFQNIKASKYVSRYFEHQKSNLQLN